mgnify:CR=1 FL=1
MHERTRKLEQALALADEALQRQGRVPGGDQPRDPHAHERRARHGAAAADDRAHLREQRRYAETIRSSGEMLLALINDILDLSKMEAGKVATRLASGGRPCRGERGDAADERPRAAEETDAAHRCRAVAAPWLRGDAMRLKQIFFNLVGNAIKFTHRAACASR